jgi:hypothetical protein
MEKLSDKEKQLIIKEREGYRGIYWHPVDIIERAKQMEYREPTYEEAEEILDTMIRNHDCNYGITWDTIDAHLETDES